MIIKTDSGYIVKVYDHGYVTLCELVNGEWVDCLFSTEQEAREALDSYKEKKKK